MTSSFEDVYRIQTARIMELERELAAARKEIEWLRKDAEIPEEPDGLDELETRNYIATLRDLLRREKAALTAARNEVESLRKVAERYLWLRQFGSRAAIYVVADKGKSMEIAQIFA